MAIPDKPIEIDLDAIGLDAWIGFTAVAGQLQNLRGGDLSAMHEALVGARQILITFLGGSWSDEEIGALNLGEMKAVFAQIGQGMRGPNAVSGLPSTPPSATVARSRSARESVARPSAGRVRRGKLRPSSA